MVGIKIAAILMLAAASRSAIIWVTRPVDEHAWQRAQHSTTWKTLAWVSLAAIASFEAGVAEAVVALAGAFLVVRLAKGFLEWRYGGLPGWGSDAVLVIAAVLSTVFMTLLW